MIVAAAFFGVILTQNPMPTSAAKIAPTNAPTGAHNNAPNIAPTPVKVDFDPPKPTTPATSNSTAPSSPQNSALSAPNNIQTGPIPVSFGNRLPQEIATDILNKDLDDLAKLIPGVWDNEIQTFFEPEISIPENARHARLHISIKPINAEGFDKNTFYAEYRKNGENGEIIRARIWSLVVQPQQMAIALRAYEPKSIKDLAAQSGNISALNALKPADFTQLSGCEILFRKRADSFQGETLPGACKLSHSDGRILNVTEKHFIGKGSWDVSDIGVDNRGQRVFGNIDDAPTHLRRAAIFNCWASFTQGNGNQLLNDLQLHDQGGEALAKFSGVPPLRLRLRNIEWPIGTNRPSLTLYLLQGNEEFAQIYAWTDPDANRIAISYANFQASCTKQ